MTAPAAPLFVVRDKWVPDDLNHRLRDYNPRTGLGRIIRDCFGHLPAELAAELVERISRTVVIHSSLALTRVDAFGRRDYQGIVSEKVITDAGVNFLVDAWQNTVELENLKFHGFGSGTTAEAAGQTALTTEFTTEYATDNTRPTGTTTEGASANIFRTVATFSPDASVTVEEHGIFDQAATGGGTLWDRSLTGTQSIDGTAGDSLEATYDMTASSGG